MLDSYFHINSVSEKILDNIGIINGDKWYITFRVWLRSEKYLFDIDILYQD